MKIRLAWKRGEPDGTIVGECCEGGVTYRYRIGHEWYWTGLVIWRIVELRPTLAMLCELHDTKTDDENYLIAMWRANAHLDNLLAERAEAMGPMNDLFVWHTDAGVSTATYAGDGWLAGYEIQFDNAIGQYKTRYSWSLAGKKPFAMFPTDLRGHSLYQTMLLCERHVKNLAEGDR